MMDCRTFCHNAMVPLPGESATVERAQDHLRPPYQTGSKSN
jgi:hypothetical protein